MVVGALTLRLLPYLTSWVVNITMYDVQIDEYVTCGSYLVTSRQRIDNTSPTISPSPGNHKNFVESQEQL